MGHGGTFKNLDAFASSKILPDFARGSRSGGLISVVCWAAMILLFTHELRRYMTEGRSTQIVVEPYRPGRLKISFDVIFHALPCAVIQVDTSDIMGRHHVDVHRDILKARLTAGGAFVDKGAFQDDLKLRNRMKEAETLTDVPPAEKAQQLAALLAQIKSGEHYPHVPADVKAQREGGEGCRVAGFVLVNKVPGHFHMQSHIDAKLQHAVWSNADRKSFNVSHTVHVMSFHDETDEFDITAWDEDQTRFLHRWLRPTKFSHRLFRGLWHDTSFGPLTSSAQETNYDYYFKVVPVVMDDATQSYQYTWTNGSFVSKDIAPALYFKYDLSPMSIVYVEERSLLHFMTTTLSIMGGVYSLAAVLDKFVNGASSCCKRNEKSS